MNMYSVANKMFKELEEWTKEITSHMEQNEKTNFLCSEEYSKLYQGKENQLLNKFEKIAHLEITIRQRYKKVCEERGLKNQDRLLDEDTTVNHNNKGKVVKSFLITISPKNDMMNPLEFKKSIDKYINRKMFNETKEIIYSFEQRQNADSFELGKGIHCHIIAYSDLPKSDIVKNSVSTFNKICDPQGVDVRPINDILIAENYVKGVHKGGKDDEEKEKKINHMLGDQKWRSIWNLKPFYCRPSGGGETSPSSPPQIETSNRSNLTLSFN